MKTANKGTIIGWIFCVIIIIFMGVWLYKSEANAPISFKTKYCPNCEWEFKMRQDFYKTCPSCGYKFYRYKDETKD